MIKWILIALLILHGVIHILGTLTEFDLVEIEGAPDAAIENDVDPGGLCVSAHFEPNGLPIEPRPVNAEHPTDPT